MVDKKLVTHALLAEMVDGGMQHTTIASGRLATIYDSASWSIIWPITNDWI